MTGLLIFVGFLLVLGAVLYSRHGTSATVIQLTPEQQEAFYGIPLEPDPAALCRCGARYDSPVHARSEDWWHEFDPR